MNTRNWRELFEFKSAKELSEAEKEAFKRIVLESRDVINVLNFLEGSVVDGGFRVVKHIGKYKK